MALPTASDNVFPKVILSEGAAPATPSSNQVKLYAKSDGLLYSKDDAGAETLVSGGSGAGIAATIFDARGDIITASAADTAQRLALGATGKVLASDGTDALWKYPPGYEFDYVENTSGTLSVTATTEAGANTILTGSSVTYDGSTIILIHAYSPVWSPTGSSNTGIYLVLWDDTAGVSLGEMALNNSQSANRSYAEVNGFRRLTPASGARVYSLRAYADATGGQVFRDTGGAGHYMPAFIRITKVSGGA